ncbi:MAG: DUF1643 domain-containing protein [Planctomycetota bacterium]
MSSDAVFSEDGLHRFELLRRWSDTLPTLAVVMLNPSRADAQRDDATIRAVRAFAERWGFGSFRVVNLFSRITPQPAELFASNDQVRLPENDAHLERVIEHADTLWFAWGIDGAGTDRAAHVVSSFGGRRPMCIGVTQNGAPRHPSRKRHDLELEPYPVDGAGV